MPEYDFRCLTCGSIRFVRHAMTQAVSEGTFPCANCGREEPHRRLFRPPAVQFKGTGFYKTDSRDEIEQWQFRNLDKD